MASISGLQSQTEEIYMYCMMLPGFECKTELYSPRDPLLAQIPGLPQYTVVKVGISTNPADRLTNIMRGFQGLGVQDAQFQTLHEKDSPEEAVEKCKLEANIIFVKKCRDIKEKIEGAELKMREVLGHELGLKFQDDFTKNLDDDNRNYIHQVGMTEWMVMKYDCVKSIQGDSRRNGIQLADPLKFDALLKDQTVEKLCGGIYEKL